MYKNITLLCKDGPIARSYINLLIRSNIKINNIIYLIDPLYKFFPNYLAAYFTFFKYNYYPINFLKDKKLYKLYEDLSESFSLDTNIFQNIYSFRSMFKVSNKITYVKDENLNSSMILEEINKTDSDVILFAGGKVILNKNFFQNKKKYIHVHSGYLYDIRGADSLLWSILKFNEIGVSSFLMNEKIDLGPLISREKFKIPVVRNEILFSRSDKEIYRFIYSFIDPIIRAKHLNYILFNVDFDNLNTIKVQKNFGKYYSFMDNKNLKLVFRKIFLPAI